MTTTDDTPAYRDEAGTPLAKCGACGHDFTARGGVVVTAHGLSFDGRINPATGRADPEPVPGPFTVTCGGCRQALVPA